jgi:hypothetical protein
MQRTSLKEEVRTTSTEWGNSPVVNALDTRTANR